MNQVRPIKVREIETLMTNNTNNFSLVLAVGVIGNVWVLIVILTSKSMRSSTNLFLLNLSLADLLVLIVCCPNAMIEMYMRTVGLYKIFCLQASHNICTEYLGDG